MSNMAPEFSHDGSDPDWWSNNEAVPKDDWTVEGELMLRGPDGHWVGIRFREGASTKNLIGIVNGGGCDWSGRKERRSDDDV